MKCRPERAKRVEGTVTERSRQKASPTGFAVTTVALGDLNRDGVLDIASSNRSDNTVSTLLGQTRNGVAPLLSFSLKTKAEATWALELMKQKVTQLSQQRGVVGATQSRLSTASRLASAVLGQANQLPALALRLLAG